MRQTVLGRRRVGRGLQGLLGLWLMLGVCRLGIRRMDKIPNELMREWSGVTKLVDKRNDEGILR